jgi:hypothetical protein
MQQLLWTCICDIRVNGFSVCPHRPCIRSLLYLEQYWPANPRYYVQILIPCRFIGTHIANGLGVTIEYNVISLFLYRHICFARNFHTSIIFCEINLRSHKLTMTL